MNHAVLMSRTIALITGASSGIGAAYARLLAADCDFVLVADGPTAFPSSRTNSAAGAAVEVLPADLGNQTASPP